MSFILPKFLRQSEHKGFGLLESLVALGFVGATALLIADQMKQIKNSQSYVELLSDQYELQRFIRTSINDLHVCTAAFKDASFDSGLMLSPPIPNFKLSGKSEIKVGKAQVESVQLTPQTSFNPTEWNVSAIIRTVKVKNFRVKPFALSLSVEINPTTKKVIKCLNNLGKTIADDQTPIPSCESGEIVQPTSLGGWRCVALSNYITNNNSNIANKSSDSTINNNTTLPDVNPPQPPIDPPDVLIDDPDEDKLVNLPNNRNVPCRPAKLAEVSCNVASYQPTTVPSWYSKGSLPTSIKRIPEIGSAAVSGVVVHFMGQSVGSSDYRRVQSYDQVSSICLDPMDAKSCLTGIYKVYTNNTGSCQGTVTCQNDGTWHVNYCACDWSARVLEGNSTDSEVKTLAASVQP